MSSFDNLPQEHKDNIKAILIRDGYIKAIDYIGEISSGKHIYSTYRLFLIHELVNNSYSIPFVNHNVIHCNKNNKLYESYYKELYTNFVNNEKYSKYYNNIEFQKHINLARDVYIFNKLNELSEIKKDIQKLFDIITALPYPGATDYQKAGEDYKKLNENNKGSI